MKMSKKPQKIIIHCSASEWGNALIIDKWHKERGWKGIGYHFVITNGYPDPSYIRKNTRIEVLNGSIESGRSLDADEWLEASEYGAHAYGYNRTTIGICLIGTGKGKGKFTPEQLISLKNLIDYLMKQFPSLKSPTYDTVIGHYETEYTHKLCPCLDMDMVRKFLRNELSLNELLSKYQGEKAVIKAKQRKKNK